MSKIGTEFPVTVGEQITAPKGLIPSNTTMRNNQWATSTDREFVLIMQADGNLVFYRVVGDPPTVSNSEFTGEILWATGTNKYPDAYFQVQADGNLVVYDASGERQWWSGTDDASSGVFYALEVSNTGKLLHYKATSDWQKP
jgi:hypothetical protein